MLLGEEVCNFTAEEGTTEKYGSSSRVRRGVQKERVSTLDLNKQ
jgi:hypothetical protein